ncbi:MAG: hypothetical protein KDJ52_07985 [Anaerolineae bacterium]|nr:hypothetical protein [Anaerolineae bacterium]
MLSTLPPIEESQLPTVPQQSERNTPTPSDTPISLPLAIKGTKDTSTPISVVAAIPTVISTPPHTMTPTESPTPTDTLTPTATPTPTITPAPKITCIQFPEGEFAGLWSAYKNRLGCPIQTLPVPNTDTLFVEQPFSFGHLFYFESKDIEFIIAKYGQGDSGPWRLFDDFDNFPDSYSCPEPQDIQPKIVNGFKHIWCVYPEIRDLLGWPLDIERDLDIELTQGFDNGFIVRDSDGFTNGMVYLFFYDDTYERVPLGPRIFLTEVDDNEEDDDDDDDGDNDDDDGDNDNDDNDNDDDNL